MTALISERPRDFQRENRSLFGLHLFNLLHSSVG